MKEEVIVEQQEAIENRKEFESQLNNMWGYGPAGLESKKAAMSMLSTKTGMYARVPITCKGEDCPYENSCKLLDYDLAPVSEPCPIETSQIELRTKEYWDEFDLGNAGFTDRNLVTSIVTLDIMIERCLALMAKEQTPIVDVVAGVTESGDTFTRPEISKSWDALDRTQRRRNELYQLMMATRRDKKNDKPENANNVSDIISVTLEGEEEDD